MNNQSTREPAILAVQKFPATQREVFKRRYVLNETPAETCRALEIEACAYEKMVEESLRALRRTTRQSEIFEGEPS